MNVVYYYDGKSPEVESFTEKRKQGLVTQVRGSTTQFVLDCLHCYDKIPQPEELIHQKIIYLSYFWRLRRPADTTAGLQMAFYLLLVTSHGREERENRLSGFFLEGY